MRANLADQETAYEDAEPPLPAEPELDLTHSTTSSRDDVHVPWGLRIGAAWAWRLIAIGIVVYALLNVFGRIRIVIVPLLIALLLTALLAPAVGWLKRARVHRSLATALVVLVGLAAVAGTLTMVISQFVAACRT